MIFNDWGAMYGWTLITKTEGICAHSICWIVLQMPGPDVGIHMHDKSEVFERTLGPHTSSALISST